jgi:hypothetical protein
MYPKLMQMCLFCSVLYTTARTFPRGACWRVAQAAPPRRRLFRVRGAPTGRLLRSATAGRGPRRFRCPGGHQVPSWATSADVAPVLAFFAEVAMLCELSRDGAT